MLRLVTTTIVGLLVAFATIGCSQDESAERHDRAQATHDEIAAMLQDPDSFGSEEDLVELIAEHATESAMMDDDVFGAVNYRNGFYNTLFGAL